MPRTIAPPVPAAVPEAAVMVASGDAAFRKQMLGLLGSRQGVIEALGGADALLKLELAPCAGLVLDRQLPDLDADELMRLVASQYPQVPVEMLDSAATALPRLAPAGRLDFHAFVQALRGAAPAPRPAAAWPAALAPRRPAPVPAAAPAAAVDLLPGLVGRSPHLADLSHLVRLVAPRRTTVLLLGETGTGKELIARGLHQASGRADKPWVVVNCAAIPEALLESELFGYARGAFTGAVQPRTGRIQAAHTGTLFLDEIGELPLALQSKLLRFLQEGELQRLGSNEPQKVDVRVVAATNQDLLARVEAGQFRRDLYYRLAVFPIELQPLRNRPADILPLARHCLRLLQADQPAAAASFSPEAMDLLERYPWPGNVRELQHAVERALILAAEEEIIAPGHFPALEAWRLSRGNGPCRAQDWKEATGTHDLI
ncbi:MAG TPA: sigma 54-interacting transcriptional regulator [Terriglobales bacterium]|nr:sigma 54-interacting transcriptional regulator [Terriglobales bacterium]